MALAAVLSALRTLILDLSELPADEPGRRSLYTHIFPDLSAAEVEDLAKIPPHRLNIYSTSIFTGEGKLLEAKLPMTWEALRKYWDGSFHEQATYQQVARRVHALRPWRSSATEDLVEGLRAFIAEDMPLSSSKRDQLLALADFELDRFYAARLSSNILNGQLSPDDLTSLTVSDLLALRCYVPSTTRISHFEFDVLAARAAFRAEKDFLPLMPVRQCVATSRADDNSVFSMTIPTPTFELLNSVTAGSYLTVEELAATYLSTIPEVRDEAQQFQKFLGFLITLMKDRVLCLALPPLSVSAGYSSQPQP
ncbi:MAG: hypothetical protein K1X79_00260 [Oligoflexia bacterium]|nr:hypothetical protein [Oligoflexia bacterium]